MSPATGNWKDRAWAKRWIQRRSELEHRQDAGEWINCDANCYCCRYNVDEGCVDTDDDANENCPSPGPTPAAAPAPTVEPTTISSTSETAPTTTSTLVPTTTSIVESTSVPTSSQTTETTSIPETTLSSSTSSSVGQEWVFPVATGAIRARQAEVIDAAAFGPVYRKDAMIVQWTPEDTTPGIQWSCESNAGNRSGGLVSSNQSQPLRIEFNNIADQTNSTDDVYCRLGFTDAPGQTVQWQYISTPNANGSNVISAPVNVATAAVATATVVSSGEINAGGDGLSTGAAAGIGVSVAVAVIIMIIVGVYFWQRRKNKVAHLTPLWADSGEQSSMSDGSGHPSYYSENQKLGDEVYELPAAPINPAELPAGIKGTPAMPSELYSDEKAAELGNDKDFEGQLIRPRPLVSHPAQRGGAQEDMVAHFSSEDGGTENGTHRSAVSPTSGTLNSEDSGLVSPLARS